MSRIHPIDVYPVLTGLYNLAITAGKTVIRLQKKLQVVKHIQGIDLPPLQVLTTLIIGQKKKIIQWSWCVQKPLMAHNWQKGKK